MPGTTDLEGAHMLATLTTTTHAAGTPPLVSAADLAYLDRLAPYKLREELTRHDAEGTDDVTDEDAYRAAIVAALAQYVPFQRRADLSGNTVTVERLTRELCRLVGRDPRWAAIGESAVIIRRDGDLVSCYGTETEFPGWRLGQVAQSVARSRSIHYAA